MSVVYIDEGFAWAVPIGGFITNFIVGGLAKSFGIIMMSTQELFDTTAAPLSLAGGLIYTFMYCFSLVGIFLSQKYGCRIIVTIGGIGCVVSFWGAFLARTINVLVIFLGGAVGFSLSFIYSPLFVMIGRCFKKRVGLAMGISVAGVSVGQIIFPAIVAHVIDTYGARGVFLVGAGIACHFLITAALMPRYIAEELQVARNIKLESFKKNSAGDLESHVPTASNKKVRKLKEEFIKCNFTTMQIVMLVIFVLAKIFGDIGDIGLTIALSSYGDTEIGLSNKNISLAIGVAGAVDFGSRIVIGFVSDQWWCRRSVILTFAWLLEALNTFFFLWWPSITGYIIFYGIYGLCSGTAVTLMTVVLTDLVSQENLAISFAIMMLTLGFVIGFGQYIVGYLADISGSYIWSMRFLGINLFLAAILMALEYPVKKICFNTTDAGNNYDMTNKHVQDPIKIVYGKKTMVNANVSENKAKFASETSKL